MSDVRDGRGRPGGLDRGSPLPLWAQLADDLRARIAAGEIAERFPTEAELMRHYDVSRHTVRESLRRLADQGLVVSRRGRGTFVTPRFDQPLGTLYSLYRSIQEHGGEQRSEVRRLELATAATVAVALGLPEDTELVVLDRLRLANGEPLAVDTTWIPAAAARPLLEVDFTRTALYDELAARCDIHMDGGEERITPIVPTAAQRAELRMPSGCGAFSIVRLGSAGSRLVEYRETVIRGDRYRFVARWSAGESYRLDLESDAGAG